MNDRAAVGRAGPYRRSIFPQQLRLRWPGAPEVVGQSDAERLVVRIAIAAAFGIAAAVDVLLAPWPFVMTPLYAVPVLFAAHARTPRDVAVTGAAAVALNVGSSLLQDLPAAVWTLYTLGLAAVAALAVMVAAQRREAGRRAQAAEEDRRALQRFLDLVSHDLRTPLASIRTAAGSLLHRGVGWTDEHRLGFAAVIDEEADRLSRLVERLLDLRRIEAGVLRPERDWYPLDAVIDDVMGRLRPATAGHPVSVDVPDDLPLVPLDYVQISQVLANLVENAARHTPPGTPIRVAARADAERLYVSVADRGPGIPADARPHVFDQFYRAASAGGRHRGTGLGLALAKGLVEAHGGGIRLESPASAHPSGAEVTFWLPLRPPRREGHPPPPSPASATSVLPAGPGATGAPHA